MIFDDRYVRIFNSDLLAGAVRDGPYGFSVIHATHACPKSLISFDKALRCSEYDRWVHEYIPDPQFQRLWRNPWHYLPVLQKFEGVISPDFSVPIDFPLYVQLNSIANGRTVGSWLQRCGVDVIPNIRWGRPDTFPFAFDGVEPGGTVAVGTLGCTKDLELRGVFLEGLPVMLERVHPSLVVVYGPLRDEVSSVILESGAEIASFDSQTTKARERR